jgi:hypothetical protein
LASVSTNASTYKVATKLEDWSFTGKEKTSSLLSIMENLRSTDNEELTSALDGRSKEEWAMGLYWIRLIWLKFQWWSKVASSSACSLWSFTPAATRQALQLIACKNQGLRKGRSTTNYEEPKTTGKTEFL